MGRLLLRPISLEVREGLSGGLQHGLKAAHIAHAMKDNVTVVRIDLDAVSDPTGFLGRNQCGAGAGKGIQHNALTVRTVSNGIGDQCNGLDRRMQFKIPRLAPKLLTPPENITLVALPPRAPELNPQENIWQYIRDNWLSNRVFESYDDIVERCCTAWRNLIADPERITSIGSRDWALTGQSF